MRGERDVGHAFGRDRDGAAGGDASGAGLRAGERVLDVVEAGAARLVLCRERDRHVTVVPTGRVRRRRCRCGAYRRDEIRRDGRLRDPLQLHRDVGRDAEVGGGLLGAAQ